MIVHQSISQISNIINLTKLVYVKLNQPISKSSQHKYILPAQVFSQIRTLQVGAFAIHAKRGNKESFCHKISHKRGFRYDHDNWYVNNMKRPFFPTEIEARRELARVGLINKNHYRPQMIQFDV